MYTAYTTRIAVIGGNRRVFAMITILVETSVDVVPVVTIAISKSVAVVVPTWFVVLGLSAQHRLVDEPGTPFRQWLLKRDLKHLHTDREGRFISVQLPKDRILDSVVGRLIVTLSDVDDRLRAEFCEEHLGLE